MDDSFNLSNTAPLRLKLQEQDKRRKHIAVQSCSMGSKHPPTEKTMADCRLESSLLPPHAGTKDAAPASAATKTKTNSEDKQTEPSGTNGVESSIANASQHAMVAVSGSPKDIICGRGLHILSHHGNHNLHLIVDRYRQAYLISTRKEKAAITKRIVRELKSTGARFLRRFNDNGDAKWVEVDDNTAYKKVSHALRLRKSDHGQNFLQSLHGPQVDSQRTVTLESTVRRETGTAQAVATVPSGPQNPMVHMPRLSSSSVAMQLHLAPPQNQLATQSQFVSQPNVGTQPETIIPFSVAGGHRNVAIDPRLYSHVYTSTLALMTQMQHQQHSTLNASSADVQRSKENPSEEGRGTR